MVSELVEKMKNIFDNKSKQNENFQPDEFDKLALKIADKTIGVCDIFINFEKEVQEVNVPKIKVEDEKDLVFFLTGLAYRLANAPVLEKKMVEFKELINEKKNHFKDLSKLKDNEGRNDDISLFRAITYSNSVSDGKVAFRSPTSLAQTPIKLDLFMKEIKTGSEKGDENIVKVKFGEIRDTAGILDGAKKVKDDKWNDLIGKFQEQVANNFNNSEFMKTLVDCTGEACKAVQDSCSSELNEITKMQTVLRCMAEKYTKGEFRSFKNKIAYNIKEYKKDVENIIDKIKNGSKCYKKLSKEDQNMADQICKFLNENLEKCAPDPKKSYFENVIDFLDCANYVNSELIVEDNADKEIKKWYNNMKIYCQKLSITLTSLESV